MAIWLTAPLSLSAVALIAPKGRINSHATGQTKSE